MSESPGIVNATPVRQPQGKKQRTPSAAQGQGKRNNNQKPRRHNPSTSITQADGTVSDTVTSASPRNRNPPGQRHSTAAGAYPPQHNSQMGYLNGQKTRPASMGGLLVPGTPAKEQAYAGPTFQASPAASALPVPKFLGSRSVPNAAHASSLQARMEGEKTPEVESSPESEVVSPAPPPRDHQSPLDIFFMADKAEKEKRKSGSFGLSPQLAARPAPPATEPRNPFAGPGRSMFLQELDGDESSMPSPKTVPYNQRPRPVERAASSPGMGGKTHNQNNGQGQQHEASTQALKDLLFSNLNASPAQKQNGTPPQNTQRSHANPQTPSPFHNPPSNPATPSNQPQNGAANYHYGNRNLSPMFKAVQQRTETPPRPSNLRQEVESPPPTHTYPDANAFSRSYLDQHLRSSVPGTASSGIISNGSGAAPRMDGGTGAKDLKGMEDDLRNLLNIRAMN